MIQELAGHASLGTTQRYMHLVPGATDDAIALLEGGARRGKGVAKAESEERAAAASG